MKLFRLKCYKVLTELCLFIIPFDFLLFLTLIIECLWHVKQIETSIRTLT